MEKKILTLCIFIISSCGIINAQNWSKEDSLWLINILEGKSELKINEDIKKAIENGNLILPSWMKNDEGRPLDLEITRDLNNIGVPDSSNIYRTDPYSMPPAVFALYVLHMDKLDSILEARSLIITDAEKKLLTSLLPTGTLQAFVFTNFMHNSNNRNIVTFRNRGMEEMLFGPAVGSGIRISTDLNNLFSMMLSPSYRRKAYNRKHAAIYKDDSFFLREPSIKISERERRQLNNAISNHKTTLPVVKTSPIRRNGIDD